MDIDGGTSSRVYWSSALVPVDWLLWVVMGHRMKWSGLIYSSQVATCQLDEMSMRCMSAESPIHDGDILNANH
jgi:hypothetical protein